jgi:predicted Zn-dependent protease
MRITGRNLTKLIISFVLSLHLCFQPYLGVPKAFALSAEEERIMGQKFLIQIRQVLDLMDDDYAQQYVNALGQYLLESVEVKYWPFHFYLVNDNDLNAFAGPGGHIFVFSGLINEMDEIDELAAVMCHEIAHVTARHLAHRIDQSKSLGWATLAGLLAGILIGGSAGAAIVAGAQAATAQAQLHYSREDERQADQLGFKYTDQSTFDPAGLIASLTKIEKNQWIGTDTIPPYLLTHPTGPERTSNLDIMLRDYSKKPDSREAARFRALWPFFKTIVRAKSVEPRDAERVFNRELEKNPDSGLAHFGLGLVMNEKSEYDLAIKHFQRALLAQPKSVPVLRSLGKSYQMKGQDAEAIAILEEALSIDPQDVSLAFLLAFSYQNLKKYEKAIRLYERLVAMNAASVQVFYNLGVSYGKEGKLALAHYNFGIYFKRLGKMGKAMFHFQKADELSKNDPALQGRIKNAMKGHHPRGSKQD